MLYLKKVGILTVVLALIITFSLATIGCRPEEETTSPTETINGEKTTEETDETRDNPYDDAVEVSPIEDRNIVLDEMFASVLSDVFDKSPKLVRAGDIEALAYIVHRPITSDDITHIQTLLDEEGYETINVNIEGYEYELDIRITEEVMEEKYDNDPGGNMYVKIYTSTEDENAQMVVIVFL